MCIRRDRSVVECVCGGGEVRGETESERKETLLKLLSRKGQPKYIYMLVLQCSVAIHKVDNKYTIIHCTCT